MLCIQSRVIYATAVDWQRYPPSPSHSKFLSIRWLILDLSPLGHTPSGFRRNAMLVYIFASPLEEQRQKLQL